MNIDEAVTIHEGTGMVVRRGGLIAVLEVANSSLADALLNARPDAIGETLSAAVAGSGGPSSFAVAQVDGDDVTLFVRGEASVMASGIIIRHSGPSPMAEQRLRTPDDGQLNVMLDAATTATIWSRLFHGVVPGAGASFGTPVPDKPKNPSLVGEDDEPTTGASPGAPPVAQAAPAAPGQDTPQPPDRSMSFLGGTDATDDLTVETPSPVVAPASTPPPSGASEPVVAPAPDVSTPTAPAPEGGGPISIVEAPESSRPAPVQVRGLRCQRDHLVHPNARLCPLCGDNMQNRSVVVNPDGTIGDLGPRPPLGVLILPDGRSFQISRTTVLGRQPDLDADVMAGIADAVILDEPNVSRRHVKIVLEDWDVYAVDLGSANGTSLAPTGEVPSRVEPNERTPINGGATIYLGSTQLAFQPTSARP